MQGVNALASVDGLASEEPEGGGVLGVDGFELEEVTLEDEQRVRLEAGNCRRHRSGLENDQFFFDNFDWNFFKSCF